jgi:hypothetical protein
MFRPSGTTPGHWLEWARLLLQLWSLGGKKLAWLPDAAKALFAQSMLLGWDSDKGSFFYTLDWEDKPAKREKMWWPACEGAAAAHYLNEHLPSDFHEESYRKIWNVIERASSTTERRLARGTDRRSRPRPHHLPRQGRHLPRPAGLPHPALPGHRQPDQGDRRSRRQDLIRRTI